MKVEYHSTKFWHNIFQSQVDNPPEGVEYIVIRPFSNLSMRNKLLNRIKKNVPITIKKAIKERIIKKTILGHPTELVWGTSKSDVDLIHSQGVLLRTDKPYVLEVENATAFVGGSWRGLLFEKKDELKDALLRENCRKILPWTNASLNSIAYIVDNDPRILAKCEVLYPAIQLPYTSQRILEMRDSVIRNKFHVLFIGNLFYAKGGLKVLTACEKLSEEYPLKLTMISHFPEKIYKKYRNKKFINLIKFDPQINGNFLEQKYLEADLFVMPTSRDTFGRVFLEAMSYGLPVIGSTCRPVPEIVGEAMCLPINTEFHDENDIPKYSDWDYINERGVFIEEVKRENKEASNDLAEMIKKNMKYQIEQRAFVEERFLYKFRNNQLLNIYKQALEG